MPLATASGASPITPSGTRGLTTDDAYRELRERIRSCELEPGSIAIARHLAAEFGMTLAPAIEAFKRLSHDGFVEVLPRAGCLIKPVTLTEVREIFELRLGVEPYAVELALKHATDDELQTFRQTCFLAFEGRPAEGTTTPPGPLDRAVVRASAEIHDDFHLQVARLSGNGRLVEMIRGLLYASRRMSALSSRRRHAVRIPGGYRRATRRSPMRCSPVTTTPRFGTCRSTSSKDRRMCYRSSWGDQVRGPRSTTPSKTPHSHGDVSPISPMIGRPRRMHRAFWTRSSGGLGSATHRFGSDRTR